MPIIYNLLPQLSQNFVPSSFKQLHVRHFLFGLAEILSKIDFEKNAVKLLINKLEAPNGLFSEATRNIPQD